MGKKAIRVAAALVAEVHKRKILALLLVGLLAAPAAMAVNDKTTKAVTSATVPFYFQKVIIDATLRPDSTGAQGAGTRDSSYAYRVREYKQLWLAVTIKARNRSICAYRYAITVRNIACMDSSGAGGYLAGYAGGDTAQRVLSVSAPSGASAALAAMVDTFCVQTWMPGMGMLPHTSGASAYSDTFSVGAVDTTRGLDVVTAPRLLPGEFLVVFPPIAAGGQNGTASNRVENGWTYYFPLADARGVFFRGNYVQVRVRPLLTQAPGIAATSTNSAAATLRIMLSGYKD